MGIGAVDSSAKVDMSSELAIKVVKDQLKMQQQMAAALTQPTLVYSADGSVQAVPPQSTINLQM
jgi:hypothetical protein